MPYFQRKVYVLSNILSIFIFFSQEEGMCYVVKVTKLFFLHVSLKAFYDRLHVLYIIYLYIYIQYSYSQERRIYIVVDGIDIFFPRRRYVLWSWYALCFSFTKVILPLTSKNKNY